MAEKLDWPGLMRAGLHGLRLLPDDFWRLTPAELMMMLGQGGKRHAPMSRSELSALIEAHPDRTETEDE